MKHTKIGIIGLGKMGLLHMGIFNNIDNCQVCAIAEKNKIVLSALKKYLPSLQVYKDYNEMLSNEKLDIVVITTPVFLHKQMILDAMEHNINIFVEKPLSLNTSECKEIIAKDYNNYSMVGYVRRFYGTYNYAKKCIGSEELGKLLNFSSQMFVSEVMTKASGWKFSPEQSGGGVLIDLGSHAIDLFHYLFGDLSEVQGMGTSLYTDVEDVVFMNMKFNNDLLGDFRLSWSKRGYRLPELKITMQFEYGDIVVTEKYISIYSEKDTSSFKKGTTVMYQQQLSDPVPINIGGAEFSLEDLHFVESIDQKKKTRCDFEEAAKVNIVVDAVYKSMKNHSVEPVTYEVM